MKDSRGKLDQDTESTCEMKGLGVDAGGQPRSHVLMGGYDVSIPAWGFLSAVT